MVTPPLRLGSFNPTQFQDNSPEERGLRPWRLEDNFCPHFSQLFMSRMQLFRGGHGNRHPMPHRQRPLRCVAPKRFTPSPSFFCGNEKQCGHKTGGAVFIKSAQREPPSRHKRHPGFVGTNAVASIRGRAAGNCRRAAWVRLWDGKAPGRVQPRPSGRWPR